ncbi:MAG: hypothetical protein R2731_01085 [Nocardioides sp.]
MALLGSLTWGLLFHVLASEPELLVDQSHAHGFATDRLGAALGFATTALAGAVGWFLSPLGATALLAALPVVFAVASEGFERVTTP